MAHLKPGQPTDNTPHTIGNPLEGIPATAIAPGVTLFTKDSRATGNAIVVKETVPSRLASIGGLDNFLKETDQKLWLAETDFGNQMTLCTNEILEMYHLGFQQDYETWWNNRMDAIAKTIT